MENIFQKRALIIINPCSGLKKANKFLTDIVETFTVNGYACTVMPTTKRGDGTFYAKTYAKDFDLVTAIGGDGTFNEVVSGVIESGQKVQIGYIPSGSTNDFAQSLGIPKNIMKAATSIVNGEPIALDVGKFNNRIFSYVASFGAFTKASYATPQNVKNALGHLAYILGGINTITSIKSEHLKIETNGEVYEDNYIFGAISNSTSLGGILSIKPELVDMSDGKFEMLLIKAPRDLLDLTDLIYTITNQEYEKNNRIVFLDGDYFKITASKDTSWSLDGEYQEGLENIEVHNLHHAINIMMR